MVTKIDTQEIMTVLEMRKRYPTKWFRYVMVGEPDMMNPSNNAGFVVFVADTEVELYNSPEDGYDSRPFGFDLGREVTHPLEVGGVVYG